MYFWPNALLILRLLLKAISARKKCAQVYHEEEERKKHFPSVYFVPSIVLSPLKMTFHVNIKIHLQGTY